MSAQPVAPAAPSPATAPTRRRRPPRPSDPAAYAKWMACDRKAAHPTRGGAEYAADRLRFRDKRAYHVYQCNYCGKYHVAHGADWV